MKRIILALLACVLLTPVFTYAQSGKISAEENQFITNYLELTRDNLLATLNAMDASKWNQRPVDGSWTVAENLEHIILAEDAVFKQVVAAMAQPAKTDKSTKHQDAWLLSKISDRGVKVQTPLPPKGTNKSKSELIADFTKSRQATMDYLKDKNLDLRTHYGRSPYGPADAYQLFIVIAGHSMRHHNQMLEALAGFEETE